MHRQTLKFFVDLDLPILGIYGMTECAGVHALNLISATQLKLDSCGKKINGVETKSPSGDNGEVKYYVFELCT